MYNNHKVVVSMTSWTKRIDNCAQVIRAVVSGTVKPDNVYLNLSQQEFPQMESQLPDELIRVLYEEPTVKINWVQGPNTKPWKKVFPILQYLNDDDLIIIIDDDCEIDPRLVELRVREFDENGGRCAIMGGACYPKSHLNIPVFGITTYNTICPTSLMQKKMLKGWETIFCKELYNPYGEATYDDDCAYSLLCLLNGFRIIPSKYINMKRPKTLDVHGLHKNGLCLDDPSTMKVFEEVYNREPSRNFRRDLFLSCVLRLVIFDSYDVAGDNGEYLYRKIRETYPNVKMVFLLSPNCSDWKRLQNDSFHLMSFNDHSVESELRNATYILFSKYNISGTVCGRGFERYRNKCVFLQHGTTSKIQDMSRYFMVSISPLCKYMCCSSMEEKTLVDIYSGRRIIPILTGFPRRDILLERNENRKPSDVKKVFITFHWRSRMTGDLRGSQYLQDINQLLNSGELKSMYDSGGYSFSFLPHAMFMQYLRLFKVPEWVEIPIDKTFQDVLVESDIIITDFSSNSFEMAYMNKPSIIYLPGMQDVKMYHGNYHIECLTYPHMFYCKTQKDVVQRIFDLTDQEKPPFDFAERLFDHVDMDNTKRLVDWMFANKEKTRQQEASKQGVSNTRQNIRLKQLLNRKPKSDLFRFMHG